MVLVFGYGAVHGDGCGDGGRLTEPDSKLCYFYLVYYSIQPYLYTNFDNFFFLLKVKVSYYSAS